jgi:hypothetical protein
MLVLLGLPSSPNEPIPHGRLIGAYAHLACVHFSLAEARAPFCVIALWRATHFFFLFLDAPGDPVLHTLIGKCV